MIVRVMILFMTLFSCAVSQAELTPEQVVTKASAVITGAKSLTVGFSVSTGGQTIKGTIKTCGNKFSVITPKVSSWYNGRDLYTYNSGSKETTVVTPTAHELVESNPLLYVRTGATNFKCSYATKQVAGKYVIELVPKTPRTGINKLTFTINQKTFWIEKIQMNATSSSSTVDVTSFVVGSSLPASQFEYPKSKFPNVEIVDLR